MKLGRALSSAYRTLKLARKSDRQEFVLYLKLVFLGFGIVGALGFIIYYIAAILAITVGHASPAGQSTP